MRPDTWFRIALLFGVLYVVVGRLFAWPTTHPITWRYAAWAASGVLFAAHIAHEHIKLRSAPVTTAWHTAVAVAIGGLGLAVAGIIHSLSNGAGSLRAWLLALALFPIVTGLPALVVAFVAATIMDRAAPQFRHSI
jgi:hypothetical protein